MYATIVSSGLEKVNTFMPRKNQPSIMFQPSEEELAILESYCKANRHSKTRVLRDLLRTLPDLRSEATQQLAGGANGQA